MVMAGNLILVLGDQLDRGSSAFDGFDRTRDRVWMAEVAEESTHVWTHKARIAVFLAGMRHFRDRLAAEGVAVDYRELPVRAAAREPASLAAALAASLAAAHKAGRSPARLVVTEPGEWRVQHALEAAGWRVLTVWECSVRNLPVDRLIDWIILWLKSEEPMGQVSRSTPV